MAIDISQVKSFVTANLRCVRKTQEVATQLNCSLDRLKKTFYKAEKLTLSRYIRESRVSRMKERLRSSMIPCKVICLDLGLREDVGARLFKNCTGMTMEQYRIAHREGASEAWKIDALRQLETRPSPRIVLTENVVKRALIAPQSKAPRSAARRGTRIWIHNPSD